MEVDTTDALEIILEKDENTSNKITRLKDKNNPEDVLRGREKHATQEIKVEKDVEIKVEKDVEIKVEIDVENDSDKVTPVSDKINTHETISQKDKFAVDHVKIEMGYENASDGVITQEQCASGDVSSGKDHIAGEEMIIEMQKTMTDLDLLIESLRDQEFNIAFVYDLYKNTYSSTETAKILMTMSPSYIYLAPACHTVKNIVKRMNTYLKNIDGNWTKICQYLSAPFTLLKKKIKSPKALTESPKKWYSCELQRLILNNPEKSGIGKSPTLKYLIDTFGDCLDRCRIGHVLLIYYLDNCKPHATAKHVNMVFKLKSSVTKYHIVKLVENTIIKRKASLYRNQEFREMCAQIFRNNTKPFLNLTGAAVNEADVGSGGSSSKRLTKKYKRASRHPNIVPGEACEQVERLKERIKFISQSRNSENAKRKELLDKLRSKLQSDPQNLQQLQETANIKMAKLNALRKKLKSMDLKSMTKKLEKMTNLYLKEKRKCRKLTEEMSQVPSIHQALEEKKATMERLQAENNSLNDKVRDLEIECQYLSQNHIEKYH
ncbi:hypothetical protein BgiMline_036918 [Biomphalaria glabrata]|nr:hypothetical protein BgiMline_015294 [Biomphalaria glabrata]